MLQLYVNLHYETIYNTTTITDLIVVFEGEMKVIHHSLSILKQENDKLMELQSLLLAKMGQ